MPSFGLVWIVQIFPFQQQPSVFDKPGVKPKVERTFLVMFGNLMNKHKQQHKLMHTKAQKLCVFKYAVISCLAGVCLEEHPDVPRKLRAVYQLDSQLVCPSVVTGFAVVLTPEVGGEHRVGAAYGADIT